MRRSNGPSSSAVLDDRSPLGPTGEVSRTTLRTRAPWPARACGRSPRRPPGTVISKDRGAGLDHRGGVDGPHPHHVQGRGARPGIDLGLEPFDLQPRQRDVARPITIRVLPSISVRASRARCQPAAVAGLDGDARRNDRKEDRSRTARSRSGGAASMTMPPIGATRVAGGPGSTISIRPRRQRGRQNRAPGRGTGASRNPSVGARTALAARATTPRPARPERPVAGHPTAFAAAGRAGRSRRARRAPAAAPAPGSGPAARPPRRPRRRPPPTARAATTCAAPAAAGRVPVPGRRGQQRRRPALHRQPPHPRIVEQPARHDRITPRRPRRGAPRTMSACAPTTTSEKGANASRAARLPRRRHQGTESCAGTGRFAAARRPPSRSTGTTTRAPRQRAWVRLAASRGAARAAVASTPRTAATAASITWPGLVPPDDPGRDGAAAAAPAGRARARARERINDPRASPGAAETPPTLPPRARSSTASCRDLGTEIRPSDRLAAHGPQYTHTYVRPRHVGNELTCLPSAAALTKRVIFGQFF